jgi:hypothetical protein
MSSEICGDVSKLRLGVEKYSVREIAEMNELLLWFA